MTGSGWIHQPLGRLVAQLQAQLDTRNNCDFGRLMIRAVFDEVSVGI